MIKVYYLPVERIDNTDVVKGSEYIHNAVLGTTERPSVRKLIMDTTVNEDEALSAVALEVRTPTGYEEELLTKTLSEVPAMLARNLGAEIDNLKAKIEELEQKLT